MSAVYRSVFLFIRIAFSGDLKNLYSYYKRLQRQIQFYSGSDTYQQTNAWFTCVCSTIRLREYMEESASNSAKFSTLADTPEVIHVTGVTLDPATLTFKGADSIGKTSTLTATVAPSNANDKSVSWSTSNESVATVSNGTVTAKGYGEATITVTTTDMSKTATAKVTVWGVYPKPAAPTLKEATTTTIELNAVSGCVYSKDGTSYQSNPKFTGLTPDTEYTFYIKIQILIEYFI